MKKIILILSFLFSFLGIFGSLLFVFFKFEDVPEFLSFLILSTKPYYFSGMDIMIETERINQYSSTSTSVGLLNLFLYLSFLSGSLIYFLSKYKETKLLIFNYSLILISGIKALVYLIFAFEDSTNTYTLIRISGLVITILYIVLSCFIINKFLNTTDNQTSNNNHLENSSKSKRFLNYIIDGILILAITFGILEFGERNDSFVNLLYTLKSTFGRSFSFLIFIYIVRFVYYSVYESIFKSTPAKFLTGCYVTDEEGNVPTFSMILKRSLFRLIPFENFSFLMDKNLHDDYSDTFVVDKKTDRKIEDRYFLFLSISVGLFLVFYFFMSTKDILFQH